MYIGVMVVKRTNLPDNLMSLIVFARVSEKTKKSRGNGWKSFHVTVSTKQSKPAAPHMYDRIKQNLLKKLRDSLRDKGLTKQQITDAENVAWEI